jgi:hypothetical protein
MTYEMVLTEVRGRVGIVTRNNPERLNALNATLEREMHDAIDAFEADDTVGAIVLTGAGRAFCAGADVKGWGGEIARGEAGERMARAARSDDDESITEKLGRCKPVVVAFNGDAIGAGFTITPRRGLPDRVGSGPRFDAICADGCHAGTPKYAPPRPHRRPAERDGHHAHGRGHPGGPGTRPRARERGRAA